MKMASGVFSVLDTETTGLFPGGHDRIAEIAIVRMNRDGEVLDRWETLVNPQRDLGKQSLHVVGIVDTLSTPNGWNDNWTNSMLLPIRVSFDNLEESKRPASEDPSFTELWRESGGEEERVIRTVQRWRAQGK